MKVRQDKVFSYESSEDENNLGKNESTPTVGNQNLETNLNLKTDSYRLRDPNTPNSSKKDTCGISNYNYEVNHFSVSDDPEIYSRDLAPIEHSHETLLKFRSFDSNASITEVTQYQTPTLTIESNISYEKENSLASRYKIFRISMRIVFKHKYTISFNFS